MYLDTSSVLKLHVEEPASDQVRELIGSATVTVTSNVAYPEAVFSSFDEALNDAARRLARTIK